MLLLGLRESRVNARAFRQLLASDFPPRVRFIAPSLRDESSPFDRTPARPPAAASQRRPLMMSVTSNRWSYHITESERNRAVCAAKATPASPQCLLTGCRKEVRLPPWSASTDGRLLTFRTFSGSAVCAKERAALFHDSPMERV